MCKNKCCLFNILQVNQFRVFCWLGQLTENFLFWCKLLYLFTIFISFVELAAAADDNINIRLLLLRWICLSRKQ